MTGSNLAMELIQQGHDVLITGTDAEFKIPDFKGKYLQPSFIGLDLNAIGSIDVLFHQAAINDTTLKDRNEMFRANVESAKIGFVPQFNIQSGIIDYYKHGWLVEK